MPPSLGEIWTHKSYYRNAAGQSEAKHLLILGVSKFDVVYRVITSVSTGRVVSPACCHGHPAAMYPAYFLGAGVAPVLPLDSWVDLQLTDDYDFLDWTKLWNAGVLLKAATLAPAILCEVLKCAANAPDTTYAQESHMMNARSTLGCP